MTPGGWPDALAMGALGLALSVLLPALILGTRAGPAWARLWQRLCPPAGAALGGFVVLHAAVTLGDCVLMPGTGVRIVLHAALLVGGLLFWLPVLGPARRLSEPGRCLYLFVGAPLLDIPMVAVIALGHHYGGLGMIVGMLPMGVAAAALTWRWIWAEERAHQGREAALHGPADRFPLARQPGTARRP
ncbi:hypothetical protein JW613_20720 [Streptomyces smyrnaeus]|uniref:Uncharacterized protein n=1 Tax=Streptomyces smyrnaeus TaxID=1387713 RepID=A0ABS3XZ75_9ACTN|nr:hypothetical protein [Streptomyces smyrnaeus]MBO8200714.1 hypothetical protein [Streptomyces smyrnaeus]